jgi:hypothetical protein
MTVPNQARPAANPAGTIHINDFTLGLVIAASLRLV